MRPIALLIVLLMASGCGGPSSSPRIIVYSNANTRPILHRAETYPYTHYILAFLIPDGKGGIQPGGALDAVLKNSEALQRVQNSGKKILISLGGGTVAGEEWLIWGKNADRVAKALTEIVKQYNLDGVDLDIENVGYKTSAEVQKYGDAIIRLTKAIAKKMPGKIITHAPQPPYLCKPGSSKQCPDVSLYAYVLLKASQHISWLNMQYYSNPPLTSSDIDELESYRSIVEGWDGFPGYPPDRLVVGKPYSSRVNGYEPREEVVSEILTPLAQEFGKSFGGFMAWELSQDTNGDWANAVATALGQ